MILSMTGYGKAKKNYENKNIYIEIKTLNSKNVDLKLRFPSLYKEKEIEMRKLITQKLKRGKIDVLIQVEDLDNKPQNKINKDILNDYLQQLKDIHPTADETQLLVASLRLPDVLQAEKKELTENEWIAVKQIFELAFQNLNKYRIDEGKSIEKDFKTRIKNIRKQIKIIEKLDHQRIEHIKDHIEKSLKQLKLEIDYNRFEQELIYYLEKLDINEEMVRLTNHLDYFEEQLDKKTERKGKKLGFISQEMGREINTIGSKANDSQVQREVVKMKDELEKIKEQVLNVL